MQQENSRFHVLNQLHELAKESDQLAELVPPISILDGYFSMVKEIALKIKSCTSVTDIEFPPDIKTVIGGKQQVIKTVNADIAETQRAHVHAEKNVPIRDETNDIKADKNERNCKVIPAKDKGIHEVSVPTYENKGFEEISSSAELCKKIQVSIPEIKVINCPAQITAAENKALFQNSMETPIMNRTFNKLINTTVTLDSAASNKSNKKSNIEDSSDLRITRSASKQKLQNSETNGFQKITQSGSKRKSSPTKSKSSKKQKTEINDSVSKSAKSRQPHVKKYKLKSGSQPSSANKGKNTAVIIPTVKQNTSRAPSKEKQIMEEIQKKEEKANENRKKVLAERQLKAEETKKKRNEKMEKTLQKRLQMEKEKGERLEKKDIDKKTQTNAHKDVTKLKPILKSRTQETIDQNMKENNSELSLKQNEAKGDCVFKTPMRKLSHNSETYDLTPVPDSSTYNFSDDDEDDKPSGKPIPAWAQGVQLKLALTHQYYNPPNIDEIFGSCIETPDLAKIFGVQKKTYTKRTSSAIWNSPPVTNH